MTRKSWLALIALAGVLGLASEAAAQRFGNPAARGRMSNPMLGGSLNFGGGRPMNPALNPGFNPGFSPGMGNIGFNGANYWRNNQGMQPGNMRVPFTYTPGYRWYTGRLPYGHWGWNGGGVPYFWYNNFWYRSMWWRGMPQFIPVPVETIPPQVQQQWNQWYQLNQEKLNQLQQKADALEQKKADKKDN